MLPRFLRLTVSFRPIVSDAEHLAVHGRTVATFAPRGDMVGIHLVELVDPTLVGVVANGAQRAVGLALGLRLLRLLVVRDPLGFLVEHPHGQQLLVGRAAQEVFEDSFAIRDVVVSRELLDNDRHLLRVEILAVVRLVQPAPLQVAHLGENIREHGRNPIDHGIEIGLEFVDVLIIAVRAHVAADVALAHPIQRPLQKILPVGASLDVGAPLLNVRVLAVAELFFGLGDERAGVDSVQKLLLVEWHASDVDCFEPLLDLGLRPLALVDQQLRVLDSLLLISGEAVEVLRVGAVHDGKLVRDEPPDASNALLTVEHLEPVRRDLVEVDQPERILLK